MPVPCHVIKRALEMLEEVFPQAVGAVETVDNQWWVETHTIGCRNHADTLEENWWEEHHIIYDQHLAEEISEVFGDPGEGKFVTITPLTSWLEKYGENPQYWVEPVYICPSKKCQLFAARWFTEAGFQHTCHNCGVITLANREWRSADKSILTYDNQKLWQFKEAENQSN